MPKIINAIEVHEGTEKELTDKGFFEITGHVIFDIKLGENFRRKARFVADDQDPICYYIQHRRLS